MNDEKTEEDSDGTLLVHEEKEISFAQTLINIKEERLYSVPEMQLILCHVPRRTIYNWLSGDVIPEPEKQQWAIERLSDPRNPPSERVQNDMFRLHNLTWDKSKEQWKLRITFNIGTKVVGKRESIPLPTRDPDMAIFGRSVALAMAKKLKLKVDCRKQKRAKT
ncbi:hypothetical protein JIN85_19620 [Luteolibacter pohnpeiensis]|uniref:Uncharacterized protein n=1 Tax=Luteolibacter pohnpeiensis TaxID=454153 RepID=A0A934S7R2_9BACT|nr:hypothetical protein [Luteolibacter pohnpeiensis]MBK1884635.1 hypothetical protein [Luteolibacter pohnpeiensis]